MIIIITALLTLILLYKILRIEKKILKTLNKIEHLLKPKEASTIEFYATINGLFEKVTHMNLKVNQKLPLTIVIKDVGGNLAPVDGVPVWSLTAPEMGVMEVAEDGMSAVLTPAGTLGAVVVQVNADADLGEGVTTIIGQLPVDVVAGDAAVIEITAGTPIEF